MKIVVTGPSSTVAELMSANADAQWLIVENVHGFNLHPGADAYFDLCDNACTSEHPSFARPLFLNSVLYPVDPEKNAIRLNGWNGFLKNEKWEVIGVLKEKEKAVLEFLNKAFISCNDEVGFIAPRVIAMIINEAFFAEEQQVSTRNEIDIAMKLGTNYPHGPFEWAEIIGLKNIYFLLKKLSLADSKYEPSISLSKSAME